MTRRYDTPFLFLLPLLLLVTRGQTSACTPPMASSSSSSSSSDAGESDLSHLFCAASLGDLPVFRRRASVVQSLGLKIENIKDDDGQNALHIAAAAGATQICRYLVKQVKLDIDARDGEDMTPLHAAILGEHYPTAVYLLENGANPNAASNLRRTSLHYAAEKGPKRLLKLLITRGAQVNAVADVGTPLVHAAFRGNKDFAKILLDNNAEVNVISYQLLTPLLSAIIASSIECVKLLLKAGADPNLYGSKRFIPLAQAARQGDTEILTCLLNAGADPNMTNAFGMTPVEVAASNGFLQGVIILFPVTSPIPTIPEWSVAGIIKHVCSDEAEEEREQKLNEYFLLSKSKGMEAFNRKDYLGAIKWYTEAYHCKQSDAAMCSNKSLCWTRLNEGGIALQEAEACIILRPDWPKAYFRKRAALMLLKDLQKAADVFYQGWMLDIRSKELECAFREAIEAQRNKMKSSSEILIK